MQDSQDIKTNPNLVEALGYYIKNKRLKKKNRIKRNGRTIKYKSSLFV